MLIRQNATKTIYKNGLKPLLFKKDAEEVHELASRLGERISQSKFQRLLTKNIVAFESKKLTQTIDGIKFNNPVGLAAGFDYDGHLAATMSYCGFGFNTIGTVTALPYKGNHGTKLDRLPKSNALFVNKGFKSEGIDKVLSRLDQKDLSNKTVGLSIGSSNVDEINSIEKAIDDYVYSFAKSKDKEYINYFELNISCPNARLIESFGKQNNLEILLKEISRLKINKPIYIKMANELHLNQTDILVKTGLEFGINGYIFSNLVKDRTNKYLNKDEMKQFINKKGNFSGLPTKNNSNKLIKHVYKEYGEHATIIGCGGIFNAKDAYNKIKMGARLVQLITGMIFEGPQLAGQINGEINDLLEQDGFENISEAVGAYHR